MYRSPWFNTPPRPKLPTPARITIPTATFPVTLDQSAMSTTVKRPKTSRTQKEKDEQDEVLIVDGIEYNSKLCIKFDIYINANTWRDRARLECSTPAQSY